MGTPADVFRKNGMITPPEDCEMDKNIQIFLESRKSEEEVRQKFGEDTIDRLRLGNLDWVSISIDNYGKRFYGLKENQISVVEKVPQSLEDGGGSQISFDSDLIGNVSSFLPFENEGVAAVKTTRILNAAHNSGVSVDVQDTKIQD